MQQVQVRIRGQVDTDWAEDFAGFSISHTVDGNTLLSGEIPDQAVLYGLLNKLSDLGLQIITVLTGNIDNGSPDMKMEG